MTAVTISPIFNAVQVFVQGGNTPLNGGLLNTYAAGTTTPTATYQDSAGATPNANPIVLGTDGRLPSELWLISGTAYKFVLTDSLGANPVTFDNISAASGTAASFTSITVSGAGTFTGAVSAATVTTTGDNAGRGMTVARSKPATTVRTSTTTLADDPDLIVPLLAGKYQFEAWLPISCGVGGGANGFKMAMAFTGTHQTGTDSMFCQADTTLATNTIFALGGTEVAAALSSSTTPANYMLAKGSIIVTAGGNLSVQWAQNSSGVQALNMFIGAYLVATEVA